jgi:DNA-binding transcriptional MerR regulator
LATYSIRDLAKLSGIKAHTIRIWEQRYTIIEPKRTASNIRYYTDEDLKFLMNIAFLNRKGIRISKIAKMTKEAINGEVGRLSQTEAEHTDHFQTLTMAMLELDEYKIYALLTKCFEEDGVEGTILNVLVPFLEKISLLWLTGSINAVHEQFASCLIRRKILTATSNLIPKTKKAKTKVLLYLPEEDQQELYLIFVEYLLKKRGVQVVYLGSKVSIEDLKLASSIHEPAYIYTIISENHKCYVPESYVKRLSEAVHTPHLLVSVFLHTPRAISPPSNVTVLDDLNELIEFFS